MGVIDLDARVKKLEAEQGGGAVIDQLEAAVTALEGDVEDLQDANSYSGTDEIVVGTWVDGSTLYQQTFALDWTDFEDPSVTNSEINGKIFTDLSADTEVIWLENGYLTYQGEDTSITILSNPLNYSTADKFVRCNIQRNSEINSGKPYLYFDCTYPGDILGSGNQTGWKWFVTIRYTKPATT